MDKTLQSLQEQTALTHAEADLLEAQLRLRALKKLEQDKDFYKRVEDIQKEGNK